MFLCVSLSQPLAEDAVTASRNTDSLGLSTQEAQRTQISFRRGLSLGATLLATFLGVAGLEDSYMGGS